MVQVATALIEEMGASAACSNDSGLSPLIIASARGLPKMVKLLLEHGAYTKRPGLGRFRLADSRQSIRGRHSALDWVELLLREEAAIGVAPAQQKGLRKCLELLQAAHVQALMAVYGVPAAQPMAPARVNEIVARERERQRQSS